MKYFSHTQEDGFVILFAVLISSIILLIGMGMFRISIKETVLSSTARESTLAFFMADSGMECALYADIKGELFDIGVSAGTGTLDPCAQFNAWEGQYGALHSTSTTGNYRLHLGNENSSACADINVSLTESGLVEIVSQGYNICTRGGTLQSSPASNNPLLLQRELFISYTR